MCVIYLGCSLLQHPVMHFSALKGKMLSLSPRYCRVSCMWVVPFSIPIKVPPYQCFHSTDVIFFPFKETYHHAEMQYCHIPPSASSSSLRLFYMKLSRKAGLKEGFYVYLKLGLGTRNGLILMVYFDRQLIPMVSCRSIFTIRPTWYLNSFYSFNLLLR